MLLAHFPFKPNLGRFINVLGTVTIPTAAASSQQRSRSSTSAQAPRGALLPTKNNPSIQSWNPTIRALIESREPTLLYKAGSHRSRTAWRLFIGISCFTLAGNCLHTFAWPPDGFNPLLRRFMALSSLVLGGCGLFAASRNVLAVKSIVAVPVRHARAKNAQSLVLRIETTHWPPWRQFVIIAQPREVSLTEPIYRSPMLHAQNKGDSVIKTMMLLPIRITLSQLGHLWHALREIVFADGNYMAISGQMKIFRMNEEPAFIEERLNHIVKSTKA